MKQKHQIVIVGGGIVGLVCAALLSKDPRLKITLLDSGGPPDFDVREDVQLRVSTLSPASVSALKNAGAWDQIAATRASVFRTMRVWDHRGTPDGPETLVFDAADFALPDLGFVVENDLVRHALVDALADTDVELRFATRVRRFERTEHGWLLEPDSGEPLQPNLVIAADGARSFVRESAGIPVTAWSHSQKALVTTLTPLHAHGQTAWQRFLPDGPIGILPLADGRVSIVWSTTPQDADAALAMDDDTLGHLLTQVTDGALGAMTVSGPRGGFPLHSQHANRYVDAGLALVGDAAHTVHPLAGQGVNLGISDATSLVGVVSNALDAGEHPGDLPTLRRFERDRKGSNEMMLRFIDGLNRLFAIKSAPVERLRGLGMYLFNRSGPIRSSAVRTALGE